MPSILGEGLAFFVAALALAFEPVAEHFMKEDRRGAAGENRRPVERLGHGSFAQGFEALAQLANGGFHRCLRGKAVDRFGFEGLCAEQIHAVVGARRGNHDQACLDVRRHDPRAFGGCKVVGLVLGGKHNHVLVNIGIIAKDDERAP